MDIFLAENVSMLVTGNSDKSREFRLEVEWGGVSCLTLRGRDQELVFQKALGNPICGK